MISTIVFDLDDTLFPEREFVLSGFRAVDQWLGENRSVRGFFDHALGSFERGERGKIFDTTLRLLEVQFDENLVGTLVRVYREHEPKLKLFPDARRVLDHLRSRKKLGLLTDGYLAVQQKKVLALGIERDFEAIIYTDQLGRQHWKPSALPYKTLMASLNSEGRECIYVGDNPQKDFVTAKELGWGTIQVIRSNSEYGRTQVPPSHEARYSVQSLDEIVDLIEGCLD